MTAWLAAPWPPSAPWTSTQWLALVAGAVPVAAGLAWLGLRLPPAPWWPGLPLLLIWSAAEEVVFRGGIQTALARSWPGQRPWVRAAGLSGANILTSLLFCAAHLLNRPPLLAAALLPVSLLLGASLERSGRLWVPIALHAHFNLSLYLAGRWL